MKILLCNERFLFRFGVDRALLMLGEALKKRGHTIHVMANRIDPKPVAAFAEKVIEVPQGGDGYLNLNEFTAGWLDEKLSELFSNDERPDVALVGGWPFFAAIPVFRAHGIQVVFLDCGAVPMEGMDGGPRITQEKLRALRKAFLPQSSQIIAISKFIEETQSTKDAGQDISATSILLGANHMELSLWSANTVAASHADVARIKGIKRAGHKILLNLGRWETNNYKNSKMLFDVVRQTRKEVRGMVALVLSDGSDMDIPADLKDQIIPIGNPSDEVLQDIMAQVDAGVSVSRWEGFNLPLAEMQWLGKPVVAFNIGAHPEVVVHPWFLADDLAQMVSKLKACLRNKGLPPKEHQEALKRFRANFSWDKVVDRYEQALLSLIPPPTAEDLISLQLFVDVTSSTRDPANSGVIRVTRSLCRALQARCRPMFIVWDNSKNTYVFPNASEFSQLGAFNGPKQQNYHPVSPLGGRIDAIETCAAGGVAGTGWLLLPETIMEANGKHIRAIAAGLRLQTGSVFYDAIPLIRPDLCKDKAILQNHADYMAGLAECTAVFPISGFSSQCLADFWRERKLLGGKNIPTLLPGEFRAGDRITQPALFDPNLIRVLCVSTLEPRKNHRTLLDALSLLSKNHPEVDWSLTLVGNRYAGGDDLARMVETACAEDYRIRWLGIADDNLLREHYETCSFTVYPSFIEGYGMPIIESLWHGKPCICHDKGVMDELAKGGGCLTVDVLDAGKMSEAIFRLATERALYDRLSHEATTRSIKTWDHYAGEILKNLVHLTPAIRRAARLASESMVSQTTSVITLPEEIVSSNREMNNNVTPAMHIPPNTPEVKQARYKTWPEIFYPGCLTENWQMNESEKLALTAVLHRHKPRCCIEIGTFKGGSLSLISQYTEIVFSIDIDPTIPERFSYFKNASFLTGPSQEILPILFDELDREGIPVDFILIDGDHSAAGVKRDLELVFQYVPKAPMIVMMHDGFNQECRRGMLEANWNNSKYAHWVDIDFIPGRLVEHGGGGHGELWGGLGCALFGPTERIGSVTVGESARELQNWAAQFRASH